MKVNLPTGSSGDTQSKKDYISLSVDRDGYSYFDKERIPLEEIAPRLRQEFATRPDAKIFIRGDREAVHGNVTRVLDQIRSSGFTKISFEIKSQAATGVPVPGADSKVYGWTTSLSAPAQMAGLVSLRRRPGASLRRRGDRLDQARGTYRGPLPDS